MSCPISTRTIASWNALASGDDGGAGCCRRSAARGQHFLEAFEPLRLSDIAGIGVGTSCRFHRASPFLELAAREERGGHDAN
jgi:hypothetical protein